ncbi:hypothetical protein G7Y89_g4956 [Cudoniella acicularis]|uniref:Uncharacterized protein n=1 Tax=Cudoniella acicularis TaxID=354080 RepID=A0A8H4RQG3_9HELO|nr:hypothetical protein G7Y89_g4956 [Cudoniella acicularis]
MSPRCLELDTFRLTSRSAGLRLCITSEAQLRIPGNIAQHNDTAVFEALASGYIVGISCDPHILESFGYEVRDAELWPQLSLSPGLHLRLANDLDGTKPDFSIRLKHGRPPSTSAKSPQPWLSSNIDFQPPYSVLRGTVEGLQVRLDFTTIQEQRQVAKRVKRRSPDNDPALASDAMLLDYNLNLAEDGHLEEFEAVVQSQSQQLSKSITECFEYAKLEYSDSDVILFDDWPAFTNTQDDSKIQTPRDSQSGGIQKAEYVFSPMNTSKCIEGDVDLLQLNDAQHTEMLLATFPALDKPPLSFHSVESVEEDMLFSQMSSGTPTLTSQTSTCSTVSIVSSYTPLKRPSSNDSSTTTQSDPPFSLDPSKASKLVLMALHILVGGHEPRSRRPLQGIQVEKPPPETSLTRLAPAMFSPGFRESLAHNAKLLPIISHAISSSLPRNVQSPTLKCKLTKLSNLRSPLIAEDNNTSTGRETSDNLSAVVQARIWAMMQKHLYDPSAARKMKLSKDHEGGQCIGSQTEDEDLLGQWENDNHLAASKNTTEAEAKESILIDDIDEFEDLLAGDDKEEDLLGLFDESERERWETEQQTDEMLFGSGWEEDGYRETEDEELLFLELDCGGTGSPEESMLL